MGEKLQTLHNDHKHKKYQFLEGQCGVHGLPYSRREATLFQGVRLFYNLIQKSVILNDIVALFLCKPCAIGSKTAKLLATLDFEMLPEFWCCITCFQGMFSKYQLIWPKISTLLLKKHQQKSFSYRSLVAL